MSDNKNPYIKKVNLTDREAKNLRIIQQKIADNDQPPADPMHWHRLLNKFWKRKQEEEPHE